MAKTVRYLPSYYIEEQVRIILCKAQEMGFYDFDGPTPLDLIVEKVCDLRIIFRDLRGDLEGVIGMLDLENKSIWLDNSLNHLETDQFCDEGRCNFTIAHEIGHFALKHVEHGDGNLLAFQDESDPKTKKIETQANMFAAMLLMPSELFCKKWAEIFKHRSDFDCSVTKMMIFFRSSREATLHRLRTLDLQE